MLRDSTEHENHFLISRKLGERKNGKKVYYLADAELIHLHRQESTKKLSKMTMIHLKSMSKFYYKYYFNKFDFK